MRCYAFGNGYPTRLEGAHLPPDPPAAVLDDLVVRNLAPAGPGGVSATLLKTVNPPGSGPHKNGPASSTWTSARPQFDPSPPARVEQPL